MAFGINPVVGMPQIGIPVTATPRKIFLGAATEAWLPGGKIIDGVKSRDVANTPIDVLQCGKLMGRIAATGLYANSILGASSAAYVAGGVTLTAPAPVVTELVRRVGASGTFKLTGPPAANGIVSQQTVTYSAASGTSITITALLSNFVAGSLIMPTDGSEDMLTFIPDYEVGQYGIKVTGNDGTNVAITAVPFALIPICGVVNCVNLIDWPADTGIQQWIASKLSMAGFGKFTLDVGY